MTPRPDLRRRGFTLIEVAVVVSIAAIIVTLGGLTFSGYFQRDSARRAAQVFAQDLVAARSFAMRSQEAVVVRFDETLLWYNVQNQVTGTEFVRRRFGINADISLSAVDLQAAGDSVLFDARGVADLSGFGGGLGVARFSSGAVGYTVSFNGIGASRIDQT